MECGIVTVDLHGRNTYQAKVTVDALLRRAGAGTGGGAGLSTCSQRSPA